LWNIELWQIGWALAGFFMVMFFALAIATSGQRKKAQAIGEEKGWHDRQHWETDSIVKGKLERQ
jgi:hypothetical protein